MAAGAKKWVNPTGPQCTDVHCAALVGVAKWDARPVCLQSGAGSVLPRKRPAFRLLVAFRPFVFSHLAARTYENPVFLPASVSVIQTRERMATATSFRDSPRTRREQPKAKTS
jgi:hypothetical protein